MNRPKLIIFDFDGVICESVQVKFQSFMMLFEQYPEHQESIRKLYYAHTGLSRFIQFEKIYREVLCLEYTEEIARDLGQRYSILSYQVVVKAPLVEGCMEFLQDNFEKHPLYILSGTPEEELVRVVNAKGLTSFFQGVYGSPDTKADVLTRILKRHHMDPTDAVFIGDSKNDWTAAKQVGVPFIGRIHSQAPGAFDDVFLDRYFEDFSDLRRILTVA